MSCLDIQNCLCESIYCTHMICPGEFFLCHIHNYKLGRCLIVRAARMPQFADTSHPKWTFSANFRPKTLWNKWLFLVQKIKLLVLPCRENTKFLLFASGMAQYGLERPIFCPNWLKVLVKAPKSRTTIGKTTKLSIKRHHHNICFRFRVKAIWAQAEGRFFLKIHTRLHCLVDYVCC